MPAAKFLPIVQLQDKATDVGCFTVWGVAQIGVA